MAIRHRDVPCDEFLCLPEVNTSHYEVIPEAVPTPPKDAIRRAPPSAPTWAEEVMPNLWPLILERLRAMADPQARSLAEGAASQSGLDEVSLLALCDWLKENQYDGIAQEVARMPLAGGNLLILRSPVDLTWDQQVSATAGLQRVVPQGVHFFIVPPGWDVAAVNWLMPKE